MSATRLPNRHELLPLTRISTMKFMPSLALGLCLLASQIFPASTANAASLPSKRCAALHALYMNLRQTDEVKSMTKGFDWVKDNIKGDQLITIKNFIETEEQMKFRCPSIDWDGNMPLLAAKNTPKGNKPFIPPLPRRKLPGDEKPLAKASDSKKPT